MKSIKEENINITQTAQKETSQNSDFPKALRFSPNFSSIRNTAKKLIYRDLNDYQGGSFFQKYSKEQITGWLKAPENNEKNLRAAMQYIYHASSHLRRLIQYFVGLTDFAYVMIPTVIESDKKESVQKKYQKTAKLLNGMDIKNQFTEILTVCFREDTYFGTLREGANSFVTLQKLPSDYCQIASREEGVFNVSFDFSYFDDPNRHKMLDYYPAEFKKKYNRYQKQKKGKWIELDSPNSFAIKANQDEPAYSVPPFAGILREIYDIEDYKQLKLSKTELENYAMLIMTIGQDKDGHWLMDFDKAADFWSNLDSVLPDQVGSVLSPMPITKIDFDNSGVSESDKITEAENNLWSAAGVSSMIFNSKITSSNALLTSIKADQSLTYGIVKSIESMLNRYLRYQTYAKNFKVMFLDTSRFNRKEVSDMAFKGCQYGMPLVSIYCASLGLSQMDMMSTNWLEDKILNITSKFKPLQSSATISNKSDNVGRPRTDTDELSDAGEASREQFD